MTRRTPHTWWVLRSFRHLDRPKALDWPKAHARVAFLTRELGPWHPDTLSARSRLVAWLSLEGDHAAALRLTETEVADRIAEFGSDHPDTLINRSALAWRRRRVGDLDGAIAGMTAVVEDRIRLLGPDDSTTHRTQAWLAQFLAENGDAAEAVGRLTALYAKSQTFGVKRQDTTRSLRNTLITALELNRDFQEALALLDEEIHAERSTVYGIDENLGDYNMKHLKELRTRLVGRAAAERAKKERRAR